MKAQKFRLQAGLVALLGASVTVSIHRAVLADNSSVTKHLGAPYPGTAPLVQAEDFGGPGEFAGTLEHGTWVDSAFEVDDDVIDLDNALEYDIILSQLGCQTTGTFEKQRHYGATVSYDNSQASIEYEIIPPSTGEIDIEVYYAKLDLLAGFDLTADGQEYTYAGSHSYISHHRYSDIGSIPVDGDWIPDKGPWHVGADVINYDLRRGFTHPVYELDQDGNYMPDALVHTYVYEDPAHDSPPGTHPSSITMTLWGNDVMDSETEVGTVEDGVTAKALVDATFDVRLDFVVSIN